MRDFSHNIFPAAIEMLLFTAFLVLGALLPSASASARGMHELNYFQTSAITHEDGRKGIRIEIGMDRGNLSYQDITKKDSDAKQGSHVLALHLEKTQRGNVREDIPLRGDIASRVQLIENADKSLDVRVTMAGEPNEQNVSVYTAERTRRTRKPYRLVIDVFQPAAKGGSVQGLAGHTIVIDPGHGGSDSGAIGYSGTRECDVTLSVSEKVQELLQNSGARTVMTRTTDVDVYGPNASDHDELQARVDVADRTQNAEIFVSIHCNAFRNAGAHGTETYYYPKSDEDYRLASVLDEELARIDGIYNRGVKQARFYVMRCTSIPASLVELAFITNPAEEAMLTDDAFQQKLAEAIVRGIARYFSHA